MQCSDAADNFTTCQPVHKPNHSDPNLVKPQIMKKKYPAIAVLAGTALFCSTSIVPAASRYWDTDGTTPGLGVGGPNNWSANLWNTDPTGGSGGTVGVFNDSDDAVFNGNGESILNVDVATNVIGSVIVGIGTTNEAAAQLTLNSGTFYYTFNMVIGQSGTNGATSTINVNGGSAMFNGSYAFPKMYIGQNGCAGTLNVNSNGSLVNVGTLNVGNSSTPGTININAGSLVARDNVFIGNTGNGTLNMNGGFASFNNTTLNNAAGLNSSINLNGGRLMVGALFRNNYQDFSTTATVNFNGGIWAAFRSADPNMQYVTAIVQSGGAIFESTRSTNATTGVVSTNSIVVRTPLLDGGTGGGVTVFGPGGVTLYAPCTYTGGTTISNGVLNLRNWPQNNNTDASISSSAFLNILPGGILDVNNLSDFTFHLESTQMLKGGGTIRGQLLANGTVAPGDGLGQDTSTLTVAGNIFLNGTTQLKLNRTNAVNCDRLVSSKTNSLGGTLVLVNVGPDLVPGDTFNLFSAGLITNSFSSITLPTLPGSSVWDTSQLTVNGTVKVVGPPALTLSNVDYSQLAQGTILFNAVNGTPNAPYTLLTTTNLSLPFNQWTTAATGTLDANGSLNSLPVTVDPTVDPKRFYILQQ